MQFLISTDHWGRRRRRRPGDDDWLTGVDHVADDLRPARLPTTACSCCRSRSVPLMQATSADLPADRPRSGGLRRRLASDGDDCLDCFSLAAEIHSAC
jgi:hypothetical protein